MTLCKNGLYIMTSSKILYVQWLCVLKFTILYVQWLYVQWIYDVQCTDSQRFPLTVLKGNIHNDITQKGG